MGYTLTSNRLFCSVTPPFHYNMKTIRSIQDLKDNTLTIEEHRSSSSTNDTPGLVLFTYSARPTTRPARVLLAGLRYVKWLLALAAAAVLAGKVLDYCGYVSTVMLWVKESAYAPLVGLLLENGWFGWQVCLIALVVMLFQPYPGMIIFFWKDYIERKDEMLT